MKDYIEEREIMTSSENDYVTQSRISGGITVLPESIADHSKPKELDLSFSNIATWPNWIEPGEYSELEVLNIYATKITELPDAIGNLSELRELHIGCTGISKLPESIGNLSKLEILHFNHTDIEELPESIGNLTALKSINAHGSRIQYLPKSFGNLTAMERLYLYYMPLKELPESIGNLTKLKDLWIQQTCVSKLPESIGNLIDLEDFECDSELREGLPDPLKSRFYYESYFDFFYKKCKSRELFACQIYLRNGTLLLIEKDLVKLSEVDERDILYFRGRFQSGVEKWDSEDYSPMFVHVESRSQKYFAKGCYTASSSGCGDHGADTSPMDTYELFGIITLYDLIEEGISYEIVKKLIPQLFQHYDAVLRPWIESHKKFLEDWEGSINNFIEHRGLRQKKKPQKVITRTLEQL